MKNENRDFIFIKTRLDPQILDNTDVYIIYKGSNYWIVYDFQFDSNSFWHSPPPPRLPFKDSILSS